MRRLPLAALEALALVTLLTACASLRAPSALDASVDPDRCLERATKLSRSGGAAPDASSYWLSLQRLGSPSADGVYGIEAAYRDMVYRECREESAAALPRQR